MSNFTPRTADQNKRMWGLAAPLGMGHDDLSELAFEISGERTSRTSELSFDEFNGLIKRLGGEPLPAVSALSTRSQQRARQKAGVKQLITQAQRKKIEGLVFAMERQTGTRFHLRGFCQRVIKADDPRTTAEANNVIEALKSMVKRKSVTAPIGRAA